MKKKKKYVFIFLLFFYFQGGGRGVEFFSFNLQYANFHHIVPKYKLRYALPLINYFDIYIKIVLRLMGSFITNQENICGISTQVIYVADMFKY